jgi:hypothetical protein
VQQQNRFASTRFGEVKPDRPGRAGHVHQAVVHRWRRGQTLRQAGRGDGSHADKLAPPPAPVNNAARMVHLAITPAPVSAMSGAICWPPGRWCAAGGGLRSSEGVAGPVGWVGAEQLQVVSEQAGHDDGGMGPNWMMESQKPPAWAVHSSCWGTPPMVIRFTTTR